MEYALVLLWFIAFQALAFVALPLAARLFPGFHDRGAAFALPVALVVVTTVVYLVGHLHFGRWTAALGVAVLLGLSAFVIWRNRSLPAREGARAAARSPGRPSGRLSEYAGVRLSAYAETVVVFGLAFALLVAVRAIEPAIVPGGGEKFLDFGIYKSLMRGDSLPPQDMWWAGGHVLYYYGGHLITATLTHLTGTAPRYAYNLALAGFYASLVTAAYGLGAAMADAHGAMRRVGGTFSAFFVGFASNLVVPVTGLVWLLPDSIASGVANRIAESLRGPNGNLAHSAELVQGGLDNFGYWAPSRVIPNTINEFPLFAFYNGDLHGHMLSTQFLLLVAALGFAYYRTPPENLRRRRALAFGVLPVVVALLGLVNVWSLPTGLGVVWLTLVFTHAEPRSLFSRPSPGERNAPVSDGGESYGSASPGTVVAGETQRIASAFAGTAVVTVLTVAWLSPFVVGVLLKSASNRSLDFLPHPTSATALLLVHGAFLVVFALYLWPRTQETFAVDTARFSLLALLVALAAWVVGYAVLALVVPLLLAGWLLLRANSDAGYETVLLVAGAGLVTLVEFAYVEDGAISGRFNTVFKVYMQVWVLWGTAAGAMLATLMHERVGPGVWSLSGGRFDVTRADLMAVVAAILLVSTSLYGGFTLQNHFTSDGDLVDADEATLDGLAYLETYHPDEGAAIHWLDDKEGQSHVVTAPGRPYQWSSPVPSLTGLPAVIGWVYQEGAYRGYEVAERREQDVDLIYTGTWGDRAELLKKHDVQYVYVGPLEREEYPDADLDFSQYPGLEPVFENESVVIYSVNHSEL